ncbi:MAG: hypothetical protein WKG07_49580 [Hymenobacter sp.]
MVARIHYVLIGGTPVGLLSGLFYWFPKMSGRMLNERLEQLVFLAVRHRLQRYVYASARTGHPRHAAPRVHLPRPAGLRARSICCPASVAF